QRRLPRGGGAVERRPVRGRAPRGRAVRCRWAAPAARTGTMVGVNTDDLPTVLVVDDDEDVLVSVERGLRLSGFRVLVARDGAAALRSVNEHSPDAVVLDMNMPLLDGAGVVTALRALGNDVPVCVLSARSSVDDRISGLESGADDYLVKPFVLAELVARIKALLRRRTDSAPTAAPGTV